MELELSSDSKNSLEDISSDPVIPYIGQRFSSVEAAESFYRLYGVTNGFETKIRTTHKSAKTGAITSRMFGCRKDRQSVAPPLVTGSDGVLRKRIRHRDLVGKTGCGAKMYVVFRGETEECEVTSLELVHNHEMVTPTKKKFMQQERNVTHVAKSLIQLLNKSGIGPSKCLNVLSTLGGGLENLGFDGVNIRNVLRDQRKAGIDTNDAQAGIELLQKIKVQSYDQFFYKVKVDNAGTLQCILWVDPRSLAAYERFGDVATFDTTYRTNRYSMPFVPFAGVNHHYQTIIFGFALMRDETEATFKWVLHTWLEAVKDQAPLAIITDQDKAMGNAIAEVLPETEHLLCTWHITTKFPERLSSLYVKYPDIFKEDFNYCIYYALTPEDFEESWSNLVETYELQDNSWLMSMYEVRKKWVRAYTRTIFSCGMTTTSRSEGMNAYFDWFVSPTTGIREFIEKSQSALEKQYMREKKSDYITENRQRIMELGTTLEYHAATLYMKEMFRRFQVEQRKAAGLTVVVREELCNDEWKMYDCFRQISQSRRRIIYRIESNIMTGYMTCSCKQYENSGTICRHLIRFLNQRQTLHTDIPAGLISHRWLKGANGGSGSSFKCTVEPSNLEDNATVRYNALTVGFQKLSVSGMCSMDRYNYAKEMIARELRNIEKLHVDDTEGFENDNEDGENNFGDIPIGSQEVPDVLPDIVAPVVHDPAVSTTKGRKRACRMKSPIEASQALGSSAGRRCGFCKKLSDHDKRNCPLRKIPASAEEPM